MEQDKRVSCSKTQFPIDLPGIIARLREAAKNEGWNQANLVMELCDRAEELHQVAAGALGYFEYMKAQGRNQSTFHSLVPSEAWFTPLRDAVERGGDK